MEAAQVEHTAYSVYALTRAFAVRLLRACQLPE